MFHRCRDPPESFEKMSKPSSLGNSRAGTADTHVVHRRLSVRKPASVKDFRIESTSQDFGTKGA
jgi:hypothetical protein